MSEWRGLHNPERHFHSPGYGDRCGKCSGGYCHPETPCRCCLAAEVEALRAQVQRVRGICEVIVENAHQFYEVWDEDPTAAQVPYGQWMVARHILRALEGDSDE